MAHLLGILNCYHPSIKLTPKYFRTRVDVSDFVKIKKVNGLLTDVFVKTNDTHQYLHPTSFEVYHSKKFHTV